MDDGSPIALDLSYHFDNKARSSGDDPTVTDHVSGFSMNHAPTGPTYSHDVDDMKLTSSRQQHNPSTISIDSVVEHAAKSHFFSGGQLQPSISDIDFQGEETREVEDNHDEHTPSWSELRTKAGKERKRLPLACIACRRKKIKCSGEKPACKHCLKARVPCVYKVTTRKAAPRTDYMAMLDKRLKRMEDRVIKIIPKEDLPDTTIRSSVRPPLPGASSKQEKTDSDTKRSAEEAFTSELQSWAKGRTGSTQLDSAARQRTQKDSENKLFNEGADALPPQLIQEHLAEVFFDCIYGQSYLLLHKPSFMRKLKAGLVPPVLILSICAISARFSTHPHVSTKPAFLRGEQWATPARNIIEKRHFEPNITILTCMIILGLHAFGTCEGGLSWSFGGQAMRMGYALQLHKELDHDPLGLAQAERAAASGKPVPRIPELSFTDREIRRRTMWACLLMDTFNSSGTERPSFLNEEYMFIQLPIKESNFQMEIPGHTEDLEGHVPLNSAGRTNEGAQAEARDNMGVAAYVIRAVVIWKRIVKYLNLGGKEKDPHPIWDPLSQFANLQRQIKQLKEALTPSLLYNKENLAAHVQERLANQFIFLHIVLAQTSLFLHRFAIPTAPNTHRPYHPNTPKSFLATAATTVLDAAAQISRLLNDSTGHTLTVPFAGYCAYSSAIVHVWGIFSKNPMLEQTSRENLRHNYKYLNRMKRYWGMFHYMAESVKDTYRAFADAAARSAKKQQPRLEVQVSNDPADSVAISAQPSRAASPSTTNELEDEDAKKRATDSQVKVLQYGDWFNKYPHGVSEQEWEQNHLPHRNETQRGIEAVMSHQADLQSVEEFFASLSPPSKADEGPNKKKLARKRGKSVADEKAAGKTKDTSEASRKQSATSRKQSQSQSTMELPQHRQLSMSSNSLYPLSERTFPNLDITTSDIDVPMSGISQGLQSGQGNSAFDLLSSTAIYSADPLSASGPTFPFVNLTSHGGPTSNPGARHSQSQQQQQQQQHAGADTSPFDYTSPASSSSNAATAINPNNSFNFSYTSAVPQLDRQMVFGGYAGIDPTTSGSTNALNNIGNFDFWNNPWDSRIDNDIDVDGFSGFNDSLSGLNTGTGGPGGAQRSATSIQAAQRGQQRQGSVQSQHSNTQHNHYQNISASGDSGASNSTAWFIPFNIEPPSSNNFPASGGSNAGFDDFAAFDATMDMGPGFAFSPTPGDQSGQG